MKLSLVLLFALLACAAVATSAQYEDEAALVEVEGETEALTAASLPAAFEAWIAQHKKQYPTPDSKLKRYAVWKANQAAVAALTGPPVLSAGPGELEAAKFSVAGPFADLTEGEFKKHYLSALKKPAGRSLLAIVEDRREGEVFFETEEDMALAETEAEAEAEAEAEVEAEAEAEMTAEQQAEVEAASFDWKRISTPVKNQGQCGSCWAHAAVEVLESAVAKAGKGLKTLSQQQQVDCNHASKGCSGGDPAGALTWWKSHGSTSAKSYPYTGRNGKCRIGSGKGPKVKTTGAACAGNCVGKEATLITELRRYGPLAIAVAANAAWQHYHGGVLKPSQCSSGSGAALNHAVVLVGYSSKGYWIVRNSWGTGWGERGYIRLAYNKDTCGLANWVSYATA